MSKHKGYKECQEKYMDETMKKYEKKKLIISGKRYVTDRKQAVAIALDTAQRKCKYTSKDYSEIKEKVNIPNIDVSLFYEHISNIYSESKKNMTDGLKLSWKDKWLHIRNSSSKWPHVLNSSPK